MKMKKTAKWVVIAVASIILVVIIAGMYKFNYLANQPGYDVGGNKIEDSYKSEVLLKWFSLNTSNDFYVEIPDTEIKCKITELINSDSLRYAKGSYVADEEKGDVLIDNSKIVALNHSTKKIFYFVIPFSISNQGSGKFKYIGIFKLDYNAKTINQTDYYFLGDRVEINSIKYDGSENLQVELKVHSENQAMAEVPSELKLLKLNVISGDSFRFARLK